MATCKICNGHSDLFSDAVILTKYRIEYFRCVSCGFIQTEDPYWLNEAYQSAIADIDIGPVDRSITISIKMRALILGFFDHRKAFLDYGAGYGILVRRMRDLGFDFKYHDAHCTNLFAKDFAGTLSGKNEFELITAVEVIEHLEQPFETMEMLLRNTSNVFFTTEVLPDYTPKPNQWWYYALNNGQHISLFSKRALNIMAERLEKRIYTDGSLHLITEEKISRKAYQTILKPNWALAIGAALTKAKKVQSLLSSDFENISGLRLTNKPEDAS